MKTKNFKFNALRAFIIGIDDYDPAPKLDTPVNDGTQFANLLETKFGYEIIPSYNAVHKELLDFLESIPKKVQKDDCVIFYYAGHGIALDQGEGLTGFILAKDSSLNDEASLIPMTKLLEIFSELQCRHFLLILDCCFAGAFRQTIRFKDDPDYNQVELFRQHFEYYSDHAAWQVITSASHTQKAIDFLGGNEKKENKNSPFGQLLIRGLDGEADLNKDNIITATELTAFLKPRLDTLTQMKGQEPQSLGFFPMNNHGNGEFMFLKPEFEADKLTKKDFKNPYMGLEAYTEKKLFFGRDRVISALKETMENNKFTVVIGASGTGKSSLVKAGILPGFREAGLKVEEMRPGKKPLAALDACGDFYDVLVIDQFEEVVTQSDTNEIKAFYSRLIEKINAQKIRIILTLRIDFEPQIKMEGMEDAWKHGRFIVPPFTPQDLREVIVSPAARVGRFIEPATLVDDIISEVVHFPGALPLLSFTLWELFEKCENDTYRSINEDDYVAFGRVTGALQKTADNIVAGLDESGVQLLKNLMFRMVSLTGGEIAGKRVMRDDLPEEIMEARIVEKLESARLIISGLDEKDKRSYSEPAHDALVRSWGTLHEWIKEFGENNIFQLQKLGAAVDEYLKKGEEKYLWHNDPNLLPAIELNKERKVVFSRKELDFLLTSENKRVNELEALKAERDEAVRQKELLEKRLRETNNMAVIMVGKQTDSSLAFRVAEYNFRHYSESKTVRIDYFNLIKSENRSLYKDQIRIFRTGIGTFLNVIAFSRNKVVVFNGELFFLWNINDKDQTFKSFEPALKSKNITPSCIALSPDEKFMYVLGDFAKADYIFDLRKMILWAILDAGNSLGFTECISFSANGDFFATGDSKGSLYIWNASENKPFRVINTNNNSIKSILFTLDSQFLLVNSGSNIIELFDIQIGHNVSIFNKHEAPVSAIVLMPTNNMFISAGLDKQIILWDIKNIEKARIIAIINQPIIALDISPDGQYVMLGTEGNNKNVTIINIETGISSFSIDAHPSEVNHVRFLADGTSFLTHGNGSSIRLWEWPKTEKVETVKIENIYSNIQFSFDKSLLALYGSNGVNVYDMNSFSILFSRDSSIWSEVTAVDFSNEDFMLITIDRFFALKIWDIKSKKVFKEMKLSFKGKTIRKIILLKSGKNLLTVDNNQEIANWDISGINAINICSFKPNVGNIQAYTCDKMPDCMLFGGDNVGIEKWNVYTGVHIESYAQGSNYYSVFSISNNLQYFASAEDDMAIFIWDLKTGILLYKLYGHLQMQNDVDITTVMCFSPDDKY